MSKMCEKGLINVTEEPDTRNATFDTGTSLKQILCGLIFSLCFQLIEMHLIKLIPN